MASLTGSCEENVTEADLGALNLQAGFDVIHGYGAALKRIVVDSLFETPGVVIHEDSATDDSFLLPGYIPFIDCTVSTTINTADRVRKRSSMETFRQTQGEDRP